MREPREPRLTRPTPQQGSGREPAFGRPARPARQEPDLFDLFPGRNDPQSDWDSGAYVQPDPYGDPAHGVDGQGDYAPYPEDPRQQPHQRAGFNPAESYPDPFGRDSRSAPAPQQRPARAPTPQGGDPRAYGAAPAPVIDPHDPFNPVPVGGGRDTAEWNDPEWDEPSPSPFSAHSGVDPVADARREPQMMPPEGPTSRRPRQSQADFQAPRQASRSEQRYEAHPAVPPPDAWGDEAEQIPSGYQPPMPEPFDADEDPGFFPTAPRRPAAPAAAMPAPPQDLPPRREPPRREAPPAADSGQGKMLGGLRLKDIDPRKPRMASPFPITGLPENPQQRSKVMLWLAVATGVLVVGGAGWLLLSGRSGADGKLGAPTIMADPSPYKVRPADPGGMQVANQDKMVYERISPEEAPQAGIEKLLPEPTVPRAPEVNEPARPSQAVIPAGPQSMETAAASAAPAQTGAAVSVGQVSAPPMVASPPAPVATTPPPSFSTPQPAVEPPAPVPAPRGPAVLGPAVTGPAPAPITPPAPAVVAAPAPRTAASGSFSVQLAALRDEMSVRKQWDTLRAKYPDLLGPYSMGIEKADLGEKGIFYRLRATGLPTEESARILCNELAKQKVGCLFVGK